MSESADEFDLEAALRAPSTTPRESMRTCPDCGSVRIHAKTDPAKAHREYPEDYWCRNCGTHFDDPEPDRAAAIDGGSDEH